MNKSNACTAKKIQFEAKRRVTHRGILINSLRYNSQELATLRRKIGEQVELNIKWVPEAMGHIFVHTEGGIILKVPVVPIYAEYAADLSFSKHNYFMKILSEGNDKLPFEAKENIQRFVKDVKTKWWKQDRG